MLVTPKDQHLILRLAPPYGPRGRPSNKTFIV
jgi:hypothetical protein